MGITHSIIDRIRRFLSVLLGLPMPEPPCPEENANATPPEVAVPPLPAVEEVSDQPAEAAHAGSAELPSAVAESGQVHAPEPAESALQPHVLSFINLKGGVGKTTTAVAVSEILAEEQGKRVLLIDLDPQTNATVSLISEDSWAELDRNGRTIAQLFEDHLNPREAPRFDIHSAIIKGVSTIGGGIARLDLLASSIQLIDIQDRIPMVAMTSNFNINPLDILGQALAPVIGRYDYVIIDCPPSLGTVTRNGLRISTGYVIPTIPDIVSTWGLYQIVDSVKRFAELNGKPIPPLGIVATKVQSNNLHTRVMNDLKMNRLGRFSGHGQLAQPPLFEHTIPQSVAVARGADVSAKFTTLKTKYGDAIEAFRGLVQEIQTICDNRNP